MGASNDTAAYESFPYALSQSDVTLGLIELIVCSQGAFVNFVVCYNFIQLFRRRGTKHLDEMIQMTCFVANFLAMSGRVILKGAIIFHDNPTITHSMCQALSMSACVPWGGTIIAHAHLAMERLAKKRSIIDPRGSLDADRGYFGMSRKTAFRTVILGYIFSILCGIIYMVVSPDGYVLSSGHLSCNFYFAGSHWSHVLFGFITLFCIGVSLATILGCTLQENYAAEAYSRAMVSIAGDFKKLTEMKKNESRHESVEQKILMAFVGEWILETIVIAQEMITRQHADPGLSVAAFLCIKVSTTIQALLVLYSKHEFYASNDDNLSGSHLEVSPTTVTVGGKSLEASPTMATVGGRSMASSKYN